MKSRVESKKSLGSHVKEKWPSVYKHGELNRKTKMGNAMDGEKKSI